MNAGVNLDYYPFENSNHYVSAGLMYNGNKIKGDGTFNGRLLGRNISGKTNVEVEYNKITPYVGFGYRNKQKSWSFNYNVGVYYQGNAKISQGDFCVNGYGCMTPSEVKNNTMVNNAFKYDDYQNRLKDKTNHKFVPVVMIGVTKNF